MQSDFIASNGPTGGRLEYVAYSASARTNTLYAMELYDVQLTDKAKSVVEAHPKSVWVDANEVLKQGCRDGRPISVTMETLLVLAGEI